MVNPAPSIFYNLKQKVKKKGGGGNSEPRAPVDQCLIFLFVTICYGWKFADLFGEGVCTRH